MPTQSAVSYFNMHINSHNISIANRAMYEILQYHLDLGSYQRLDTDLISNNNELFINIIKQSVYKGQWTSGAVLTAMI